MKTTSVWSNVKIEEEILLNFQPVNETLATGIYLPETPTKTKQFGVVDLWNCNKKRRFYGIRIS